MNLGYVLAISFAVVLIAVTVVAARSAKAAAGAHRVWAPEDYLSPLAADGDPQSRELLEFTISSIRKNLEAFGVPASVYVEWAEANTDIGIGDTVPQVTVHGDDLLAQASRA